MNRRSFLLSGMLAFGTMLLLTAGCSQMKGPAVDPFTWAVKAADEIASGQPIPKWQVPLMGEGADILAYLDETHLLVGVLMSDGSEALPRHGALSLVDTRSGNVLWQVERPELSFGSYQLVAGKPVIILLGQEADQTILIALDPKDGRQLWKREFSGHTAVSRAVSGDSVLVASRSGKGKGRLASFSLTSGKGWSVEIKDAASTAPVLLQDAKRVYWVGGTIVAVAPSSGRKLWHITPDNGRPVNVQLIDAGLLWTGATRFGLTNTGSGKNRWVVRTGGVTASLSADQSQVYRLLPPSTKGQKITTYSLKNGHRVWSRQMPERLASGLFSTHGRIWLSDTKSLRALDRRSGKQVLRVALPRDFAENGPYEFTMGGQLDILVLNDQHLELIRERAGMLAISLSNARIAWTREWVPGAARYIVTAAQALMRTIPMPEVYAGANKRVIEQGRRYAEAGPGAVVAEIGEGASLGVEKVKRSIDYNLAQRRVRSSDTLLGSHIAHTQNTADITGDIVAARAQSAQEGTAAGKAFAAALGQAILAIRLVQQERHMAHWSENRIQRHVLESLAAFDYHHQGLQGGYVVRPYSVMVTPALIDATALTLIDVDTGMRSELLYGVRTYTEGVNGFMMPAFAVSPSGRQVTVNGTGLQSEKIKSYQRWNALLPRQSLMAYALADLAFSNVIPRSVRERLPTETAANGDLAIYAGSHRIGAVRRMLATGVDPNTTTSANTPLAAAAFSGDASIVKLLLQYGADPQLAGQTGWTSMIAMQQGKSLYNGEYDEVQNLLIAAGALPLEK